MEPIKDTSQIPAYLNDITLEFQEDRQLRGYIPSNTHLLENSDAEGDAQEYLAVPDSHPVPLRRHSISPDFAGDCSHSHS